jgi:hypothetical protein
MLALQNTLPWGQSYHSFKKYIWNGFILFISIPSCNTEQFSLEIQQTSKTYIQKKICKTVARTKRKAYCKEMFRMFNVVPLTVYTWYQYYLLQKTDKYITNSDVHNIGGKGYIYELNVPNFKEYTVLLKFHLQSSYSHGTRSIIWPVVRDFDFFYTSGSLVVLPVHHLNTNKTI